METSKRPPCPEQPCTKIILVKLLVLEISPHCDPSTFSGANPFFRARPAVKDPSKSQGLVKVMIIGEGTPQGDRDSVRAGVLQNL